MAPYLLFGFLLAGVLSVLVAPAFVQKHLGKRGFWQVCKASLLGVPLPLCSCGVLPVSASLRKHGAGRGATLSFLASTPQTGLDSIMVTYGLLGPAMVMFRLLVAFFSGVLGGVVLELSDKSRPPPPGAAAPDGTPAAEAPQAPRHAVRRALRYGFVALPREIGGAMLLGILIAGLLAALIPEGYLADKIGTGLLSMIVMMLVGIPIYACSAGSVPIALSLMRMGLSGGAALVFLVTAPATNAATIATIVKVLGKRAAAVYLGGIAGTALAAGLLMDALVPRPEYLAETAGHAMHAGWFNHLSAVVLLALFVGARLTLSR